MKLALILIFGLLQGCAGYAHFEDYKQNKKIQDLEQRLNSLEKSRDSDR